MDRLIEKQKKMIEKSIKHATIKQVFTWLWWSVFSPKKSEKLIKGIEEGRHWHAAFKRAQQKTLPVFTFAVTGVHHGSLVEAESEAHARDIFTKCWGEEILYVKKKGSGPALMYS